MHDVILHHYPESPFSEKIRRILAFKAVPWNSVVIPVIMPKPDLMPLTGGYRKTPVMQIGANIYCDSAAIARELDRRYPDHPLYPTVSVAAASAMAAWTDSFFSGWRLQWRFSPGHWPRPD
ncbi:MAG: glutathione S-transferase N-terminal domain-containing protein [Pseudomonadota bacterium]